MVYFVNKIGRDGDKVGIVVVNYIQDREFFIQKFFDPNESSHQECYNLIDLALKGEIKGKDLQKFNNLAKSLAQENENGLIKIGVLDQETKLLKEPSSNEVEEEETPILQ